MQQSHYGYKGFLTTDQQGSVRDAYVTPANCSEVKELETVVSRVSCQRLFADKG